MSTMPFLISATCVYLRPAAANESGTMGLSKTKRNFLGIVPQQAPKDTRNISTGVSTPKLPCSSLLDFSGQQVQFVEMEHVRAPPTMGHKKRSNLKRAATAQEGVSLMSTVSAFHVSDAGARIHVSKDGSPPCTPVKPNFYI
ncbi:hypothetical protein E4U11_004444 [Claviceps purpurea]|nr:hypothetical protein E4U11_004444 [Claviceps purpurea]